MFKKLYENNKAFSYGKFKIYPEDYIIIVDPYDITSTIKVKFIKPDNHPDYIKCEDENGKLQIINIDEIIDVIKNNKIKNKFYSDSLEDKLLDQILNLEDDIRIYINDIESISDTIDSIENDMEEEIKQNALNMWRKKYHKNYDEYPDDNDRNFDLIFDKIGSNWEITSGHQKYTRELERVQNKLDKAKSKLKELQQKRTLNNNLPMNESYNYLSPSFIDIIQYAQKHYPYINKELNYLLNRYNNGENVDNLIDEFKDIISSYDTIVFDTNGDPILEDSTDIDLAMLLINI